MCRIFHLVTIISRLLELTMDNKYITDSFCVEKKFSHAMVILLNNFCTELISVGSVAIKTLGKSS